jgi:hypothetical protein
LASLVLTHAFLLNQQQQVSFIDCWYTVPRWGYNKKDRPAPLPALMLLYVLHYQKKAQSQIAPWRN